IQHKRREKVVEFFEIHGAELQGNPEWLRWFALPFSRKPEADPEFDLFFSKAWLDTFTVSLHNFLSTVFQNMPLPSLLCFNVDRLHRKELQSRVEALQNMIQVLREEIQSNDAEISTLRDQVAHKKVEGARRRRAASMVEQQPVLNTDDVRLEVVKRSGSRSSQVSQTTSDAASLAKSEAGSESSGASFSEEDAVRAEEAFVVVSQEIFLEHQSGITHAKFSTQGHLIASCDADNTVRIWTYNGSSAMVPAKISNTSNVLSLAWETRDRYVFLGTDAGSVRCFSLESRTVVREIKTGSEYPRVRFMHYSPAEPFLICALAASDDTSGALISINMKTMTIDHTVVLSSAQDVINAVGFNHNGQMVVTGDVGGKIKIYDIKSLSAIMDWEASSLPILACTFSFDETSIYSVDSQGQLSQDSVHKHGQRIGSSPLQGFTTSTLSSAMMMVSSSSNSIRSQGGSSGRSKPFIRATPTGGSGNSTHVPRIQLESSGGTVTSALGVDESSSKGATTSATASTSASTTPTAITASPTSTSELISSLEERAAALAGGGFSSSPVFSSIPSSLAVTSKANKESSGLTTMNVGPGQLLSWSGDTDHIVMGCGNAGVLVQTSTGQQVQPLLGHAHPLTCVDWSAFVGACLTGAADGTIRISKLMRV
ncbi:WD repeat-containing protein 91, partial [Lunasporangiospora selenospora]